MLGTGIRSTAQNGYWQQYLHYTIDVQLNEAEKSISGSETLVYKNNSPQALSYIWFHVYPNAYRDKTTALFTQLKKDLTRQEKLKNFTGGFISNLAFTVNGTAVKTEPHSNPQYIDIIKVVLPQPLQSGDSITIATPFKVQLPPYFSRSGFADGEFMVCQWYPKPAVFDKDGWHEMPYLDMGEFYSEYASYNVHITLPAQYVVSATGVLQTAGEADAYKSAGGYNVLHHEDGKVRLYSPVLSQQTKTLSYFADSVPDFAWFADKDFIIGYDTMRLPSGKITEVFTWYHSRSASLWANSIEYVKDAVRHYDSWVGEYAYPVVQAVEGTKNSSSGGMEYPTVTLITSPEAKPETLDAVIAHEVGHNWFMSMLGTNERTHPWMDEGLNSYYQFRYEAEKYRTNSVFGNKLPDDVKKLDEENFQQVIYKAMSQIPVKPALETPSAGFEGSEEYALTAYVKTAEWMYLLENAVGRETVDKAFQNYFAIWKFKHPQPLDMKAAFEQVIKGSLNQFFSLLKKEGALVK